MAVSKVKLRMLYIMKILSEKSDERHTLSAADINRLLQDYGMAADRKTIYSDIETLREFHIDIVQAKGTNGGYYIGSREFELPELKLLVDAVQTSKFISCKKSKELIRKLENLTNEYDARLLQRNVFIYNRPETKNETIYYNVNEIHTAILENYQIRYQYAEWTVQKKLIPKKNGAVYMVSPWALTWDDANYYLIAYDKTEDVIKHYRVDKMQQVQIIEKERVGRERFQKFDLAEFAKKTFGMYGGQDVEVTLTCCNELAGVIIDRFGKETILIPIDEEHFRVHILVAVSRQFFGWLTGIGKEMKIESPKFVREEYRKYLQEILQDY